MFKWRLKIIEKTLENGYFDVNIDILEKEEDFPGKALCLVMKYYRQSFHGYFITEEIF